MATQFAVDLVFKSQGLGKLDSVARQLKGVEGTSKASQRGLDEVANGIRRTGRAADQASGGINKLAGAIKGVIAAYAVVQGIKFVFGKTAELQTQTRSLQVLTQSAEKARDIVKELQDFGNVTPFTSSELIETAKRLKAFGVDTERLVDTTKRLGDVAGATGADLSGIATAYGQIMAKGRLQGEELLQLQERGVDLQGELQKMYGLTGEEFRKALEKGQVSAKAVEVALTRLTEKGGKYANGAIAQSDTLAGRLSTLQDNIQRLAQNVGRILTPLFDWVIRRSIEAINAINSMFGRWQKEDLIGQDRKNQLLSQAARDAEKKFGRFTLSEEKKNFRNRQYEAYLNNEAIKKGFQSPTQKTEVKVKIDPFKVPELLGGTSGGSTSGGKGSAPTKKDDLARIAQLAYGPQIIAAAKANNIDPRLLAGLVQVESGFNARAVSHAGAAGLTQLMPGTAADLGVRDRFDPMQNLMGGAKYLRQMISMFGSVQAGLRAYNQGPGNQQRYPGGVSGEAVAYPGKVLGAAAGFGFGGQGIADANAAGLEEMARQQELAAKMLADAKERLAVAQAALAIEEALTPLQAAQLQTAENKRKLEVEYNGLIEQATDDETKKTLERAKGIELKLEDVKLEKELKDLRESATKSLTEEIEMLQARLAGTEDVLQAEREIAALRAQGVDGGAARRLVDTRNQLQKQVEAQDKAKASAEALAGSISSALTDSLRGLIDGSMTAEEALANAFKGIADAFIDMAMQMIQEWIKMQIMGIFKSSFGGGLGLGFANGGYGNLQMLAAGDYISSPTPALVGEGGSNEYVIPESKMSGAMARWNAGARGDAVINGAETTGGEGGVATVEAPAQINISGGVMQFNDTNYIRQDQLPGIISQAGKQGEQRALRKLQMSAATRRRLGM